MCMPFPFRKDKIMCLFVPRVSHLGFLDLVFEPVLLPVTDFTGSISQKCRLD